MGRRIRVWRSAAVLLVAFLCGCATSAVPPGGNVSGASSATLSTDAGALINQAAGDLRAALKDSGGDIPPPVEDPYIAPDFADCSFDEAAAEGADGAFLDLSHTDLGYVGAKAKSNSGLKLLVEFGSTRYTYDLPGDETVCFFPLQSGNGSYSLRVMENVTGNKYAQLYATTAQVTLQSEFEPFLRPNQLIDYNQNSFCTQIAQQLAAGSRDDVELAAAVYSYVKNNISYDYDKLETVESGYLPDPDRTLAEGKGICYDYAALTAAMLRSQGIPCKLLTGYVGSDDLYHAWNLLYLKNKGWVAVSIQAGANRWQQVDITFAASGEDRYTPDDYSVLYTY